eukprot:gb/GECH01009011.1/.p1 GENE.gb/GECH01009011.1/~~gb/GECH01009011.1/.p1  ORF type:complete len:260 (+),score=77.22 gb/GECH01009011.1/:1-780(+)
MQCLEYFSFSPEQVINKIMENNLPPNLKAFIDSGAAEHVEQKEAEPKDAKSSNAENDASPENVLPNWLKIKSVKRKQKREMEGYKQQKGKKKISMEMDEDEKSLLNQRILESYMYEDEYDDTFEENVQFGMGEGETEAEEGDHDNTFIKLISEHDNNTEESTSTDEKNHKDNTTKKQSSTQDNPQQKSGEIDSKKDGQAKRKKGNSGGKGRGKGHSGLGYGADMSEREKKYKQKNKSRIANHDRKKQAAKKANKSMPHF